MRLKTILKEPLLHFLVIGIVLFVAASASRSGIDRGVVLVTYAEIELLAANYAKAWGRAPTQDELRGVIDDRVQEEIAVREALAAGLERDDTIIRRYLNLIEASLRTNHFVSGKKERGQSLAIKFDSRAIETSMA